MASDERLDDAAARPPDAAIIDLTVPGDNGIDVGRQLRGWSQMPILVLSAIADEARRCRRSRRAQTTTATT